MVKRKLKLQSTALLVASLGWGACFAQDASLPLNFSVKPQLFDSEFVTSDEDESDVSEARLKSGLGLTLASDVLALDVDYEMQSVLKHSAAAPANHFSQQLKAALKSSALNDWFGLDAGLRAATLRRDGGDIYRYKVTPGVSRSLSGLARLSVNYDYMLDKAAAKKAPLEKRGYSMLLDGSLQGGRLSWSGRYRTSSIFKDRLVLTQAIEALDLKSRYLLRPAMHLELSSAIKHETRFRGAAQDLLIQKRYGAAIAWSPSQSYSLAFKIDSLQKGQRNRRDTFGSGTFTWTPRPALELTLDYGQQLVDGSAGVILHTRFDISG